MISGDDIEAFRGDCKVVDVVLERVQRGVPEHRRIYANEEAAILRVVNLLLVMTERLNDELMRRGAESMEPWLDPARTGDAARGKHTTQTG